MQIRKAYKFRIKTNIEIERKLFEFLGSCRFLWNKSLALCISRLENKQKVLRYYELDFWSKLWKHSEEYGFLKDTHSQLLQQKLKDLDKAFKDCFDKKQPNKRLPRFKKKGVGDSFRYNQGFKVDGKRLYLPKLGWVGFFKSREIIGDMKNVTISRRGCHWYCSIQVEYESADIIRMNNNPVGIDVGIAKFATLSNGKVYEPKNAFKNLSKKLTKEQRALSRKKKFSNNWRKQKQIITKTHEKISNIRNDHLHKTSTEISKNHAMIFVEDLQVSNMSSSSRGTRDTPGKNVKAKAGLNKSILDQGWFEFRRQLEYKSSWSGGRLVAIDPKYTSQQCSCCGHREKGNRMSQSLFRCLDCGMELNADKNAAKNILAAGQAVLACGEEALVTSVKQELLASRETRLVLLN